MSVIIDEKGKSKEEVEALEIAEDSRQTEWKEPSFVADLFMGNLNYQAFLPYPEQEAEDRKLGDAYLTKLNNYLKENLDPDKIDETGEIPAEIHKGLAEIGAFGLKIPKKYGGMELSQINYAKALAVVSRHCGSTLGLLSAHQSIGVPQPLKMFGTKEQKEKYLPRFAKGEISAFALTEPNVGSDPAKMETTATPSEDGNHYIINGKKLWCTNGVIADTLVVMARTPDIEVKGRKKKQITAFIVEKTAPGFKVEHRCRFMGLNGVQNGLLSFDNVKVPKENIILGVGQGLKLALITLNAGRIGIPAGCIGGVREGLAQIKGWANERVQWGAPVGKHEAGAKKIASAYANLFALDAITWAQCLWVDNKVRDIRIEAAMAKVFASLRSHAIAEDMLQLRGGRGYETATSLKARGETPMAAERCVRDSRINQIVEGTTEILSLYIARESLDRHLSVAGDMLNPKNSLGKKLAGAIKAISFYVFWYPRQWVHLAIWPRFAGMGVLGCHLRFAIRNSHKLARTTFHQMVKYGPALPNHQLQLIRLVEIATDLFAMTAAIGRAHTKAQRGSDDKNAVDLADLFCCEAKERIRNNFRQICCNYDKKIRTVGKKALKSEYSWVESIFEG